MNVPTSMGGIAGAQQAGVERDSVLVALDGQLGLFLSQLNDLNVRLRSIKSRAFGAHPEKGPENLQRAVPAGKVHSIGEKIEDMQLVLQMMQVETNELEKLA